MEALRGKIVRMSKKNTNFEHIAQAIADLETLLREELIALHYEIIGTRDSLSEELGARCDEIKHRLDSPK